MERLNVIITGGCGFIGSHIVDKLVNNYNVFIIDNESSKSWLKYISHTV